MESKGVYPARIELLKMIDQQIATLMAKSFAGLTADERSEFKNRQQRIRDLEQQLAFAQSEELYDSGVFSGIYP